MIDDREMDARLTKIEQGIAYLVQKEMQFEEEERIEYEEENNIE